MKQQARKLAWRNVQRFSQSVVPLGVAFASGAVFIWAFGYNPLDVYRLLWQSAFGSFDDFGYVLFSATPLIFTGLAVAIGFRGGLFNIGCEGQLYVAGFAAAWVGFSLDWMPSVLAIPACLAAGMCAGALWAAVPGLLKARFGAHEVINTIMMNFIAIALTNYLVTGVFMEPNQMIPQTPPIREAARFPRLASFLPIFPVSNPLSVAFLIALATTLLLHVVLWHTVWGYEIRFVGNAPDVATYGGINVARVTVLTMALSGAVAGLAGIWDVMGYRFRFLDNFSPGFGYTGIAVALLGQNHALGVVLAALLFGALSKGALDVEILMDVPREVFTIIQAVLILTLISKVHGRRG